VLEAMEVIDRDDDGDQEDDDNSDVDYSTEEDSARGEKTFSGYRRTRGGVRALRARIQAETEQLPPEVGIHVPADVQSALANAFEGAQQEGLSEQATHQLRSVVTGELSDMFRTVLSNDPPASVEPIKVEMRPGIEEIRNVRRQYKPEAVQFMDGFMRQLKELGYVEEEPFATMSSPAHVVRKPGVDPDEPLDRKYRLTVDLRKVNEFTVPMVYPLPHPDSFGAAVVGKRYFGKLDLFNGYWQLPLHPDSQRYFCIQTDKSVYRSHRLIQGSRNATGPFQATMVKVLGDLVGKACLVFVDDILVFGKTEREFVANWIAILRALNAVGLKVNAKKTLFYAEEVLFCGKLYSSEGVRFNPAFVEAVTKMAKPETAAELRTYIASANWMRAGIPDYAKLVLPLQDLLKEALRLLVRDKIDGKADARKRGSNTRQAAASRIYLADVGWTAQHDEAFMQLNAQIAYNVMVAHPDPGKVLCVYTDASDNHWAGVVTQCEPEELGKPTMEQRHQPLAFVSGTFSGSQLRWPTVEKEGFALKETCLRTEHILQRPGGFEVYTDHRNLEFIYSSDPMSTERRQAADRIERWKVIMRGFKYRIHHVAGEANVVADMLSRWAARARDGAGESPVEATVRALAARARQEAAPGEQLVDSDAEDGGDPGMERPGEDQQPLRPPTVAELKDWQERLPASVRRKAVKNDDGLWTTVKGQIIIPNDEERWYQLFKLAHSNGGHRGAGTTARWLQQRFHWTGLTSSVRRFVKACAVCAKTRGAKVVRRGWLGTPRAYAPNKSIHFDYMFVRTATDDTPGGAEYILVIVDSFSKYAELVAAPAADARHAAEALLSWFARNGVVRHWTSDQGSHFVNQTLERLRELTRAEHHVTAVYAPWSNGQVERVNGTIQAMMRAIMLDARLPGHHWPYVLPTVMSIYNNAPSTALGGYAPITVFSARPATSPLDVVFDTAADAQLRQLAVAMTPEGVKGYVDQLQREIDELHRVVREVQQPDEPDRGGSPGDGIVVGDLVLTARLGARVTDKTAPYWEGPAVVTSVVNQRRYRVRDIANGREQELHACHLKKYAGKDTPITNELRDIAAHGGRGYIVEAVTDHRFVGNEPQLLIQWEAYEAPTWQKARDIFTDVPALVQRYVRALKNKSQRDRLAAALEATATRPARPRARGRR